MKSEDKEEEEEDATVTEKQELAVQAPPPAPKVDRVAALSRQTFIHKEESFAEEFFRELGDLGTKMRIHGYRYRYNFHAYREMMTEYTNLMYLLGGHCEDIEQRLKEVDSFVEDLVYVPRRLQIPHVLAYISHLLWKAEIGFKKPREKTEYHMSDKQKAEIRLHLKDKVQESERQRQRVEEVMTR